MLPGGGSRYPATRQTLDKRLHYIKMQGNEVFKVAVNTLGKIVDETLADNGLMKADIDWLVGLNPVMHTIPLGMGPEGRARLELAQKQCPMADHFISDPDYNLIAIKEAR